MNALLWIKCVYTPLSKYIYIYTVCCNRKYDFIFNKAKLNMKFEI